LVKGNSEAVLVVIVNISDPVKKEYSLLIKTTRLAIGSLKFWELPGGLDSSNILQGIGFEILDEQLVNMNQEYYGISKQVYLSPEATDDSISFKMLKKEYDQVQFDLFEKGVKENKDNELLLVPLEELAWYSNDSKTFIAMQLYQMLKRRGTIPAC